MSSLEYNCMRCGTCCHEVPGDYVKRIPIYPEEQLVDLIKNHKVEQVVFSYSDVPHTYVMNKASLVLAAGADFRLMGINATQIKSSKPVVSVCAVRTGSGKSQTRLQHTS